MQCQTTKKDGKRCRAQALSGKRYCSLHSDPGKAAELGSKGGRRRSIPKPAEHEATSPSPSLSVDAPKTAEQVRDLLGETMAQVRKTMALQVNRGKSEIKTANTLAYVGTALLRAIEISTFEERVAALEVRRRERTGNEFG